MSDIDTVLCEVNFEEHVTYCVSLMLSPDQKAELLDGSLDVVELCDEQLPDGWMTGPATQVSVNERTVLEITEE